MNEELWLGATTPCQGVDYLCSDGRFRYTGLSENRRKAGRRKLRLFLCACARRVWKLIPPGPCRRAVELGERLADGEDARARIAALPDGRLYAGPLGRRHAAHAAMACVETNIRWAAAVGAQAAAMAAGWAREVDLDHGLQIYHRVKAEEEAAQAALLRDVYGNPFRPVSFFAEWGTSTAVALCEHMYESRDFSAMPILADALQDAGCDSDDILGHCRGPGLHARGCWVVDSVVGKG